MRAYQEEKKESIVSGFVGMMDFAVRVRREKAGEFVKKFLDSGIADKLGRGDPFVSGLSGVELYEKVTGVTCYEEHILPAHGDFIARMRAVALYQFESGRSFREMYLAYPVEKMTETDKETFFAAVEERIKRRPTNLELFRSRAGLSQSALALLSGVDIRSIQMYEQRRNDISKAQYNILNALCRVLHCTIDDLMDENNYRLAKGETDEYPLDTFMNLCLLACRRREFSETLSDCFKAQAEARKYFYAYGCLATFPKKKLSYEKGVYAMEQNVLVNFWNAYFRKMIEAKKAKESLRSAVREKVAALCPAGKALTPDLLVQAILSAVDTVEEM